MTCRYGTQTARRWLNCRCEAVEVECRCPDRQHPHKLPYDYASIHTVYYLDEEGNRRTDCVKVKSTFCCRQHCAFYEERATNDEQDEGVRLRHLQE